MLTSFPRDIVAASSPGAGPRHVDFGLVIGVDHYPRFRSVEAGLYKLEDSSGQAVMFDHGGAEVTRVVF